MEPAAQDVEHLRLEQWDELALPLEVRRHVVVKRLVLYHLDGGRVSHGGDLCHVHMVAGTHMHHD